MADSKSSKPALIAATPNLTHAAASLISAACRVRSAEIGVPMNIAIVDTTLHLLHFERLPNAKLTSIDIAINKAYTAAGHRAPTSVYKDQVWPGGKAFGLNSANGGKFMYVAGGVPIKDAQGRVVGAVGCSTGTPDQDDDVSRAGVAAFERALRGEGGELKAKL